MPSHDQLPQKRSSLYEMAVGIIAKETTVTRIAWPLAECENKTLLISDFTETSLRAVIWSGVVCFSIYLAFRSKLIRWPMLSLILFPVFSVAEFAVAAINDIPSLNDVPLVGRHGVMGHLFKKFLFAGWVCSISYLFYDLLPSPQRQRK